MPKGWVEVVTVDFHCARCGKKLGTYSGDVMEFDADVPIKNLRTTHIYDCLEGNESHVTEQSKETKQ